jgi:hypothetical protein
MKVMNPKMRLWEIAQECKVARAIQFVKNDGTEFRKDISAKKLILANTASRLVKKAALIVKNVEQGKFPF